MIIIYLLEIKEIVEFYKRSLKGGKDFDKPKEVMIRNYRMHLIIKESDLNE
jgi:hypothetical protein